MYLLGDIVNKEKMIYRITQQINAYPLIINKKNINIFYMHVTFELLRSFQMFTDPKLQENYIY